MTDDNKIVPIDASPPKRRGRKKAEMMADHFDTDEKKLEIQAALREVMVEVNQPRVMSDNQLKARLNEYLNRCYHNKQYPTVEEGFLSTGYTRKYLMDIAQGKYRGKYFSPEAAEILGRFIDICATFDAKLVMQGKAPMIGYIYRSKQHYGMSDKSEVQLVSNVNTEQEVSLEDIAKRYAVEAEYTVTTIDDDGKEKQED